MLAFVLCAIAGCVEPVPEPPCTMACEAVPAVAATLQAMAWQDCKGLVASLEVPRERVDAVVPESFELRGLTDETASLVLELVTCPRAASDVAVLTDVSLARLQARVRPVEDSWKGSEGGSHFVFLTLAGGDGHQPALGALGVEAQEATARVDRAEVPRVIGASAWSFESSHARMELEIASTGGSSAMDPVTIHYWHPSAEGLRRIDATKDRDLDSALPRSGLLRLSGAPIELDAWPWTGQAYENLDETWVVAPERFGGDA